VVSIIRGFFVIRSFSIAVMLESWWSREVSGEGAVVFSPPPRFFVRFALSGMTVVVDGADSPLWKRGRRGICFDSLRVIAINLSVIKVL
jgi:hypothetical protein